MLVDGTTARKNHDAALHRPWPGGFAEPIGLRGTGLETRPGGYEVRLYDAPAGRWSLARMVAELEPDAGWTAWPELRFSVDGEPCVWERRWGRGRIVVARGMLGPALVHHDPHMPAVRHILGRVAPPTSELVRPVSGSPVNSPFQLTSNTVGSPSCSHQIPSTAAAAPCEYIYPPPAPGWTCGPGSMCP